VVLPYVFVKNTILLMKGHGGMKMVDNICLSVLGGFVLPKAAERASNPDLWQLLITVGA
jgi:hypothetical protein